MIKQKTIKILLGLAAVLVVGSSVLFAGVAKADNLPVKDQVLSALAGYLVNHPDSDIAKGLLAYLLGLPSNEKIIGATNFNDEKNESPFGRIAFKDSNTPTLVSVEGWETIPLPTAAEATTTVARRNGLSQTFYVDYAQCEITGTVSSTFSCSAGATATGFVAYNTASPPNNILPIYSFVTSTAAVQFDDTYSNFYISATSTAKVTTSTPFVTVFLQSSDPTNCKNTTCEQVTSTSRGWNGKFYYRYHYFKSI